MTRRRTLLLLFALLALSLLLVWQPESSLSFAPATHPAAGEHQSGGGHTSTGTRAGSDEATTNAPAADVHASGAEQSKSQRTRSANRAPFLVPKRIGEGGKPLSDNVNDIACWDRSGRATPRSVPAFAPLLFRAIRTERAYLDLHAASEDDPWAVLIGWVPSRFMGPQPVGKDSQGRRMVPPTRGRDPAFYLREYNASWHAAFTDEQQRRVYFQLAHRNSFAVCVRERIHLHVRRCRPAPHLPPILIHSCLCRKCDERSIAVSASSALDAAAPLTRAVLHFPETSTTGFVPSRPEFLFLPRSFLRSSSAVQTLHRVAARDKPQPQQQQQHESGDGDAQQHLRRARFPPRVSGCLSVYAAPWLVSREQLAKFPYEGLEHNLDALLAAQAEPQRRHVMVTIFNAAWVDHLLNWVFSLVRNGRVASFIVATMDDASLALCRQLRLPCYDAGAMAEREDDDEELRLHPERRRVSEAMSWIKPRLATAVIGRGYGFWMVDLDMSWNANPIPHVVATAGSSNNGGGDRVLDLVHQCDAPARFSINSGFYDAAPTLASYLFFNNMMTFTPEENADQAAMRLFGRYDHTHGMLNDCLNKWQFDMKCNYKVPNSVKTFKAPDTGAMQQSFEWNPVERNRTKFRWVTHHATCLNGAMAKVAYLRTINAWFLDDLDAWEQRGQETSFCWTRASGDEISVASLGDLRTPHSPKYSRETDEKFLARRH